MDPSADKSFSQKSIRPNSMPSTVSGLSSGMSIGGKNGGISRVYGVAAGEQSGVAQGSASSWQRSQPVKAKKARAYKPNRMRMWLLIPH